ncbi:hypothetical protein HanHA300_Chr00c0163g0722771 [Helianthus annuus]|nr:hypothetical protein HanHA89_Chr05g0176401 [Helianthus annuus]KAJ0634496.1 hypothetical protein HanHA300_Chr00c0163g0722771 [Helianthus annuus]KAJ0749165.1 hypothetical protein HanLR1_Chr05g0166641 [Helianthus annuus]
MLTNTRIFSPSIPNRVCYDLRVPTTTSIIKPATIAKVNVTPVVSVPVGP